MNKKMPFSVRLLVLTAITVVVWVGFEVYRVLTSEPDPVVPEHILAPISPSLDTSTLNSISQRIHLTEEEIGDTVLLESSRGSSPGAQEPLSPELPLPEFLQPDESEESTESATSAGETVVEL